MSQKKVSKLENTYEFDKTIKKESHSKSNLIYDTNHSFYKYYGDNLSFQSKHSFLNGFFNELDK